MLDFESAEASEISAILEEAGLAVRSATGPTDLPVVKSSAPEAILVASPASMGQDAAALCGRLRRSGYRGAIIAIGGSTPKSAGVDLLEAGADDFVRRPLDAADLLARIRAVLRRLRVQSTVQWGSLKVDRGERVVHLRSHPLQLTLREYALLASLVEAQGEMVTREELLTRLGVPGRAARSNIVEVHMSRVRSKLGVDARLIETVWRGGYRLRRVDEPGS